MTDDLIMNNELNYFHDPIIYCQFCGNLSKLISSYTFSFIIRAKQLIWRAKLSCLAVLGICKHLNFILIIRITLISSQTNVSLITKHQYYVHVHAVINWI